MSTVWSARWPRECAGPAASSVPGWSRSRTSTCNCTRAATSTSSPRCSAIDAFATDIVSDYGRYTSACAVLETAERLAGEERAPAPELHRLTIGALRAVADGTPARELVLDAYLLRAMGIAGWAPALTECARCAAPGPHRAFHVAAGGSVCVHCRPSGSATPPQGVLDLMVALHDGDWEHAEASPPTHRSQASGLVAAHLQWHLERQLRTLPLVERGYRGRSRGRRAPRLAGRAGCGAWR